MVSMNMAARNHCSRPIARGLHGHNGCPETSPKALSRLNFQVEDSEKFGLERIVTLEYKFAAAREHARNGFRVFPVVPNDKKPVFQGWQVGASTDENRFRQWLT